MNALKYKHAEEPGEEMLYITRTFDAPRSLVFKAWTDPERLMRWWGPNGFTLPVCTIDLRPGGVLHYCMRSPDGKEYWGRGVYRQVVEPERIVYTDCFSDEKGNVTSPTQYGLSAEWPMETEVTVTFAEQEGRTLLTLESSTGDVPAEELEMCRQGWNESLDRLAAELGK
ncbi:MAG: SRPBCC domain-containing protein [Deltaproteobacteria bacterium]|nr:SRPBCC domain-containing protein [Deltaproteobacteria bacterium]